MTGALVAIAMVLCATIFITLIVVMLRRGSELSGMIVYVYLMFVDVEGCV